ncbi:Uncharacterised protein [Mycobacterium tuberculosis]|nr:Uncharacterised protein [Mycobacterium tuberculosis]CNU84831.1 Uncharacterised protein [Mycobacterium tuberculosis]
MLDAHVAQHGSLRGIAGGRENLRSLGAGNRYGRLPHTAGGGVNQHFVTGLDLSQVVEPIPGGGMRGGRRDRLLIGQAGRQRDREVGVTGEERPPTATFGETANTITDLVTGDTFPDRSHHTDEIHTQLRLAVIDNGESSKRDQNVGEVDAGHADRDFDLPGAGRNSVTRNEFQRLQVSRPADLHPHTVVVGIQDRGAPLFMAQRTGGQAGHIPVAIPPGRLVLFRSAQQLLGHPLNVRVFVHIDQGGAQHRMFTADHP